MSKNTLWIDDPLNILFDLSKIIPDRSDSLHEQVNSFTRFILLYGTILSVYKKNLDPLVFAMVMSIAVLGFVWFMKQQTHNPAKQLNSHEPPTSVECITPKTIHNPFANPMMGARNCNAPSSPLSEQELFVQNLPLDEWDIYGKNNSQRQFFSVPHNDQTSFAKWLYDPGEVCKTNTTRCTGY